RPDHLHRNKHVSAQPAEDEDVAHIRQRALAGTVGGALLILPPVHGDQPIARRDGEIERDSCAYPEPVVAHALEEAHVRMRWATRKPVNDPGSRCGMIMHGDFPCFAPKSPAGIRPDSSIYINAL